MDKAISDVLTARDNSIGSSGGTTLVIMRMQSNNNFDFFRPLSTPKFLESAAYTRYHTRENKPFTQTYQLAAMAKMRRNPMKRNDSKLFADTRSVEKIMVRMSWP